MVMSRYDLDPADIRKIAGAAGGLDVKTVERFLDGRPGQVRKHRAIVAAMKLLGFAEAIPKLGAAPIANTG